MEQMREGQPESGGVQEKISKLKQQIRDIDRARTEGSLNQYFRWPNPVEAEQMAEVKVERLEEQIRELEQNSEEEVAPEEVSMVKNSELSPIDQRLRRIKQLEDAKKTDTLSLQYGFNPNYLELAEQEVSQLEKEIRALEEDGRLPVSLRLANRAAFPEEDQDIDVSAVRVNTGNELSHREPKLIEYKPEEADQKFQSHDFSGGEIEELDSQSEKEKPASSSERIRRKIGVVETDLVKNQSRDIAEERMTADKKELKGVRGFFKKIWRYNWAKEYYRLREIQKVKGEIERAGSVYGEKDTDGKQDITTKQAILSRFLEENPDLIHLLAGEKVEENQKKKAAAQISLRGLIRDFASNPNFTEEGFIEERNRIFARDLGLNIKDKESLAVSSELLDMARNAKDAIEHGESLNNLDLDFELVVGRAKSGTRTEAELNTVDKIIDKIKRTSVGRFVNETTIAGAYALTLGMTQRAARSKAAAWLTFGGSALVGGTIIGATENVRLKQDRSQMEREDASGQEFAVAGATRRQEMSKFMLEKRNVDDLSTRLSSSLYEFKSDGTKETKNLSLDDYNKAVANLADIESRIRTSDSLKIDLLRYSSVENIEVERTALDVERYQAKKELRKMFSAHQNALGVKDFDEYLNKVTGTIIHRLTNENSDLRSKQKLFKEFKRRKVGASALEGVMIGLTVGAVAQEVGVFFNQEQEGVVEHGVRQLFGKETPNSHNFTALEAVRRYCVGAMDHGTKNLDRHLYSFGPGEHFRLPAGVEIKPSSTGGFDLVDLRDVNHTHVLVNNISYDEHGNISAESFKQMQDSGVMATREAYSVAMKGTSELTHNLPAEQVAVSPQDYLTNHGGVVSHLHRDWSVDDLSPNRLGIGDPTVDNSGNIIIRLNMTTGGSVMADGSHIDPLQAAAEGKFRVFFTENQYNQAHPAEMLADPNGQVVISPDNPIYKMFKVNTSTHQVEVAPRFIEAGVLSGQAETGQQAIIVATQEGAGGAMSGLTEAVGGEHVANLVDQKVHITNFDLIERDNFNLPPIIPMVGRTPLERVGVKEPKPKKETESERGPSAESSPNEGIIDAEFSKVENQNIFGYKIGQSVEVLRASGYVESGWKISNYQEPTLLTPGKFLLTKTVNGQAYQKWVTPSELDEVKKSLAESEKIKVDFSQATDLRDLFDLIRKKKIITNSDSLKVSAGKVIELIKTDHFEAVTSIGDLKQIAIRLKKEMREKLQRELGI